MQSISAYFCNLVSKTAAFTTPTEGWVPVPETAAEFVRIARFLWYVAQARFADLPFSAPAQEVDFWDVVSKIGNVLRR